MVGDAGHAVRVDLAVVGVSVKAGSRSAKQTSNRRQALPEMALNPGMTHLAVSIPPVSMKKAQSIEAHR